MRKPNGMTIKSAVLCLAALSLSSCAGGRTAGEHIADMPHWMGGLPADAPPRRGTPEYDLLNRERGSRKAAGHAQLIAIFVRHRAEIEHLALGKLQREGHSDRGVVVTTEDLNS